MIRFSRFPLTLIPWIAKGPNGLPLSGVPLPLSQLVRRIPVPKGFPAPAGSNEFWHNVVVVCDQAQPEGKKWIPLIKVPSAFKEKLEEAKAEIKRCETSRKRWLIGSGVFGALSGLPVAALAMVPEHFLYYGLALYIFIFPPISILLASGVSVSAGCLLAGLMRHLALQRHREHYNSILFGDLGTWAVGARWLQPSPMQRLALWNRGEKPGEKPGEIQGQEEVKEGRPLDEFLYIRESEQIFSQFESDAILGPPKSKNDVLTAIYFPDKLSWSERLTWQ